jgi:hypothetical protein
MFRASSVVTFNRSQIRPAVSADRRLQFGPDSHFFGHADDPT